MDMPEDKAMRSDQAKGYHEPWGAACAALMEGNQQAAARWMRALLALSQEVAQFAQSRLQEDAAAWTALGACRSPEDAMEWQRRFAAKATEQYYDEISKLSQMVMRMAGEGFSSLQQRPSAAT
jgi:hypothetical protein